MRELTINEVEAVTGASAATSAGMVALAAGIGAVTWGSTWGMVGVGVAFAAAPIAAGAMVGLAFASGVTYFFS